MSVIEFTELPTVPSALASDVICAVQGGLSVKETLQQVLDLGLSYNTLNYAGNPNGNVAGKTYQFAYDTTNKKFYICTTTGSAATAVWTLIGANVVAIGQGGTGVTSVTTSPTASAWAAWDANSNLSADNFIEGYATTATAAGTTTLTVSSAGQQFFTGSTTQTVVLPVTSTLVLGQAFEITNNSSGVVTVQSSGSNTIQAMAANTKLVVTCILTSGTGTASWSAHYSAGGSFGTVTSVSMTVPSFLSIGGSPVTTSGTLAVSLSGTALPVSSGGTNATSAGITAFNNITGYTAAGATGTTSTNLVFSTSPTITTPVINGVTDASSAGAGVVGQVISSNVLVGSAVALTTATPANVTSISLTAGDWDVYGQVGFVTAATTTMTQMVAAISTVSATPPAYSDFNGSLQKFDHVITTGTDPCINAGTCRINVSGTTTVYLVASMDFAVDTSAAYGYIFARRRR